MTTPSSLTLDLADAGGEREKLLTSPAAHQPIFHKLLQIYCELFNHDGFGEVRVEMRILRRGQKEVIIHYGKQHRFVLDCNQALASESALKHLLKLDLLG